eukprot:scaffold128071_cov35-Attheya_sp.AAC.1
MDLIRDSLKGQPYILDDGFPCRPPWYHRLGGHPGSLLLQSQEVLVQMSPKLPLPARKGGDNIVSVRDLILAKNPVLKVAWNLQRLSNTLTIWKRWRGRDIQEGAKRNENG